MNYFEKYKEAKICLYSMISQFYNSNLSLEKAKELNYSNSPMFSYRNYVEVCFHNFESNALLAWDYLNFNKDYYSHEEIWEKRQNVKYEEKKDSIDYEEKYLKMSILLIDMIKENYGYSVTLTEANELNIPFDDDDELDNEVSACYHLFETAGEITWNFFEIEEPIVGKSIFDKKRELLTKKLLEKSNIKKKKLK